MVHALYSDLCDNQSRRAKVPLLPRGAAPIVQSVSKGHDFVWVHRMWICTCCQIRTINPVTSSVARSKCKGVTMFDKLLRDPKGHTFWCANIQGGGTVLYCSKCWAYCQSRPNKLLTACDGVGGPFGKLRSITSPRTCTPRRRTELCSAKRGSAMIDSAMLPIGILWGGQ